MALAFLLSSTACSKTDEIVAANPNIETPTSGVNPTASTTDGTLNSESEAKPTAKPQSIDFTLSYELDPASVNSTTVVLTRAENVWTPPATLEGTVLYVADQQKIVFQPANELALEGTYRATLRGLRSSLGTPILPIVLPFTPTQVADSRVVQYRDGEIASYITESNTDNGALTQIALYSAGSDMQWFTKDDQPIQAVIVTRDAVNKVLTRAFYSGSGPDNEWFTPDDILVRSLVTKFNAQDQLTNFADTSAPGPDGIWFTADDTMDYVYSASYDSLGRISQAFAHDTPGADGTWFTYDDVIRYYETHNYATADAPS